MERERLKYCIAASRLRIHSLAELRQLLKLVGSEEQLFSVPDTRLRSLTGRDVGALSKATRDAALMEAEAEATWIEEHRVTPLYFDDPCYPQALLTCDDAPKMLYTMGPADLNNPYTLAIVGTRHATGYGIGFVNALMEAMTATLAVKPLIVSGLAHGIDIAAHRAAIKCGLPTAAVLAHGLNTIYPAVHRSVAADIARERGVLVTEYISTDRIHQGNFLDRNRIIAGLGAATLVAESAKRGGALRTARVALEYNREVFAVPGRLSDPYSEGCNRLIYTSSAHPIVSVEEFIDVLDWPKKEVEGEQQSLTMKLTPQQQAIVDLLTAKGQCTLNVVATNLQMPMGKAVSELTGLEISGVVVRTQGNNFSLGVKL